VLHLNNAPASSETRHASGVLFAVRIIVDARDCAFFIVPGWKVRFLFFTSSRI